jgi:hypothetical protein
MSENSSRSVAKIIVVKCQNMSEIVLKVRDSICMGSVLKEDRK